MCFAVLGMVHGGRVNLRLGFNHGLNSVSKVILEEGRTGEHTRVSCLLCDVFGMYTREPCDAASSPCAFLG